MPRLIWTPRALGDLARVGRFLSGHDPAAARRAIRAVRAGMRLMEAHPGAGRAADGMAPEFRERWVSFGSGGYVVLYQLRKGAVLVLAVRHGREVGF